MALVSIHAPAWLAIAKNLSIGDMFQSRARVERDRYLAG